MLSNGYVRTSFLCFVTHVSLGSISLVRIEKWNEVNDLIFESSAIDLDTTFSFQIAAILSSDLSEGGQVNDPTDNKYLPKQQDHFQHTVQIFGETESL